MIFHNLYSNYVSTCINCMFVVLLTATIFYHSTRLFYHDIQCLWTTLVLWESKVLCRSPALPTPGSGWPSAFVSMIPRNLLCMLYFWNLDSWPLSGFKPTIQLIHHRAWNALLRYLEGICWDGMHGLWNPAAHELSFGHMQLHQLLLEVERVNDHSKIHFFDRPQIPRIWQANVRLISRRIKSMSYKTKLGKYRDESEISLSCSCLGALKCMLANNVGMNWLISVDHLRNATLQY